jgi:hypothetical protein
MRKVNFTTTSAKSTLLNLKRSQVGHKMLQLSFVVLRDTFSWLLTSLLTSKPFVQPLGFVMSLSAFGKLKCKSRLMPTNPPPSRISRLSYSSIMTTCSTVQAAVS